jgi:hypothetical protein
MKDLPEQDREAIVVFVSRLRAKLPELLRGVVLYGSKARNEARGDSDIDLLVILTDTRRVYRNTVVDTASDISVWHDVLLLPHIVSLDRWQEMGEGPFSFFQEVFQDGWPVYGEAEIFAPLQRSDLTPLYDTAVTA